MKNSLLKLGGTIFAVGGLLLMSTLVTFAANEGSDDSSPTPSCHLRANPSDIIIGGGTTLIYWTTGGVVEAKLYPKGSNHLIKTFSSERGWHWISGIVDSRDYNLVVKNEAGKTSSCTAHINVVTEEDNSDTDNDNKINNETSQKKVNSHHHHKHKYSRKDKRRYNKHKKYRGAKNKAIYKKIKNWKKHNPALYFEYRTIYKKYKGTSHKKLQKRLPAVIYDKYRQYRIYHEYKEYRQAKKKLHK